MEPLRPEGAATQLDAQLRALGFQLTPEQASQFLTYLEQLLVWNKRVNLVSPLDEGKLIERHFVESAGVLAAIHFPDGSAVLDLGTGGGFPGLPLKILRPDLRMTLLDSKRRKTLFLQNVTHKLRLANVEVVHARAEEAAQDPRYQGEFDVVVSRAVTKLGRLLEWGVPFLRKHGRLLAIKGGELDEELSSVDEKLFRIQIVEFPCCTLASREGRKIVVVQRQKFATFP